MAPMSGPPSTPHARPDPEQPERHPLLKRLEEAALEAERDTGTHESTDEALRRGLAHRLIRGAVGMIVIVVGILALPLPGPGLLIIIVGLTLLPFAWAERMVHEIRHRTPGVPADGKVPPRTWAVMGAMVALATTSSILWGDDLTAWVSAL